MVKVRVDASSKVNVKIGTAFPIYTGKPLELGRKTITENGLYDASSDKLDGYSAVEVDVAGAVLEKLIITPTISQQIFTPPDGVDGYSIVETKPMPQAQQAAPVIEMDENGKVTATVNQQAGYVVEGTKSASLQLETQKAQIITPGDKNQEIPAGVYLTGKQTIARVPTQEKTVTENGEHEADAGKYFKKVLVNVPQSSGTDTDDATSTPADMAEGATAYVKGEKITGALPVLEPGQEKKVTDHEPTMENGMLALELSVQKDKIYRAGAKVILQTPGTALGGATPDQVLQGESFSSQEGVAQEGMMPNNGDTSATIDGVETKSVVIPAGYTEGGTVALDGTIDNAVEAAKESLSNKGVEVPTDADVRGLAGLIDSIPEAGGGGELQELDVTPSHEAQEFIPAEGVAGYKKVLVKPVPRVPAYVTQIFAGYEVIPATLETVANMVHKTEVTAEHSPTYMLYNGVKLPNIPIYYIYKYQYMWIRADGANSKYDLVLADAPWYYTGSNLSREVLNTAYYYSIAYSEVETATDWGSATSSSQAFGLSSNRTIVWSNHDIPNGSATATDIYFEGTNPVPVD